MAEVQTGDAGGSGSDDAGRAARARPRMRRSDRFWTGPVAGLILLAALAGLYALVTRKPVAKPAAPALLGVSLDQITALRFAAGGKTLTLYSKKGGALGPLSRTWTVGSPTGQAADTTLVGDFVTSLLTLAPVRTLAAHPTQAELRGYGLLPPTSSVTMVRGVTAPVTLDVGIASPVGSYYAAVSGKPAVYLISASLATQVSANPDSWLAIPTTPAASSTPATSSTPPASSTPAKSTPAKSAPAKTKSTKPAKTTAAG